MPRQLNARQQKFAELYEGNGTEAARRAGYRGSDNTLAQAARDLLRNPHISKAIEARNRKDLRVDIADRQERQAFWTGTLRDVAAEMKDRLKASELLGKSEADFTEKHQHDHRFSDMSDEQLEARYRALVARATATVIGGES